MATRTLTKQELLDELAPTVEAGLDRHIEAATPWLPHEFVPYEVGRNFVKEPWQDTDSDLPEVAQIALEMNLLTEDNLPYYHLAIWDGFGRHDSWAEWVRRWTAEEGRHAIVLRDYLVVTRGIDPAQLERERMDMVQRGFYPSFAELGPMDGVAYASVQELATRISHRNTGLITDDETAVALTQRVAMDENLHFVFYRDMTAAALAIDPSQAMEAIKRQVLNFEMPGAALPQFAEKSKAMAKAGIYNLGIHFEQVLTPILTRQWRIQEIEGLSDAGKRARDEIFTYMDRLKRVAARLAEPLSPINRVREDDGPGFDDD